MIVSNIIAVTFLVIIGTTFVISAGKQRLELKQKVIRHKAQEKNSSDVLLGALSDFGIVRRSLSPVLIEKYSIHYAKDEPHVSKNDESRNVIEKLKISVTFRDNILYILSYLLHGRDNGLTEEQYSSLQILYEFFKKKKVYVYNLLPILSRLNTADKNQQTAIMLSSLNKNLPSYLQCAAKFLANEIEQERIDLNKLLSQTTSETFDYLANMNLDILKGKVKIVDDEIEGYDKHSNITRKALGPVFVKLLYNLHAHKLSLSQQLFGLILINLPNPNDDPVLEENIRYLYDLTKNNAIDHRNWNLIGENPVSSDAYTLVFSVLSKILVSNVGMVVKNAAAYVYHHLRLVMTPTYDNPNMIYLHRLIQQDIDIGMLLSAIVPQEFGPNAIRLKDRLVTYFALNYGNEDVGKIFHGFNKFAYRDPLDLLIAFLTRLVNRIPSFPSIDLQTIKQSATALLSTLIVKKSTRTFTPFVSPEIDVLILLESLKIPDIDPTLQSTIDFIKFELIAHPQLSVLVSTLLPTEKHNCLIPIQCLISTFQKIQRLRDNLPVTLITRIQTIAYILKTRLIQLPNYFIPYFSIPSIDTDIAYFNVSNYKIKQPEEAPKVPNRLNKNLYGWNLSNYYNITPVAQAGLFKTTRRQSTEENKQTTKQVDSVKTKVETSTVTNQPQVTEHVKSKKPSRKNLAKQHLTSSSATTVIYNDFSESTNKPLQKSEKKQPRQPVSVITPNIIKNQESDVDSLNTKEEEISPQSNKSEEIESQTYPLEETDKDDTTKKSTPLVTKTIRKRIERRKSGNHRDIEKPIITATTTILPDVESNVAKKQKPNVGTSHTKEEEILAQPNKSEEIENQTYPLDETDKDTTTKKPVRLVTKAIRKNIKRRKTTNIEKPTTTTTTTTTTTILPNIESHVTEKQESNIGISSTNEEEIILSQSNPNTSEENESQAYSVEEVNKDVTTKNPTQSVKTIRKVKEETSTPEETTNDISENVTTIVLPPSIQPNEPLKIQLSNKGVPIVTPDDHNKTVPGFVLPQVTELLKSPNTDDFFSNDDTPIVTQILQPLSVIFGKNYIKKILQDEDINIYSTNIALLLAILKKAITQQQVITNTNLTDLIEKYISVIEYISPTILLPIVVSSKKLVSKVVYSTFNVHDLTHSVLSEKPPVETFADTITIPLVNPKIWLQSINPSDPYVDLLPTLEEKNAFAKVIQPLQNILTLKKIEKILGPDFQPLVYPNKGTLLITLLQKLRKTKTIQSNSELLSLINMYIHAIEIPSTNIQVSEDNLVKMMSETTGQWQPELTSLIVALPTAKNVIETAMIQQIEKLLADPTLLEKLHVVTPPSTMSRGELLHKIILSALSGKIQLKKQVLKAFKYYKDKVEFTDMGALPIMWMWVEMYVVKAQINLGSMIQQTVDFNQLAYKEKVAYNDLITYLAQNPNLLQDNEDFEFQKYKTQGQFIRGLFKHLLKKPQINEKIKKNIQKLLSRVMLTGPGAIAIPNLSGF